MCDLYCVLPAITSVVGSPNGPVMTYADDDTQEFQWDPDYDGDDGYWDEEIQEDSGSWEGSSGGEVVEMQDIDGEQRMIPLHEFQRQWVDACSRMNSVLQTREKAIEHHAIAQVSGCPCQHAGNDKSV